MHPIFASLASLPGGLIPEVALLLLVLAALALWIWMIVDCVTKEPETSTRIAWLLVILLAGIIGAIIYYFVRKRARK